MSHFRGAVHYPTYGHILWKNFVDNAFDASIQTVVIAATWELTVPKICARIPIKFGVTSTSLDLIEAQTLKGITHRELETSTATPLGKLYSSVSADALNAETVAAAKAAGEEWFPAWEDGTLVRQITLSKERSFVRVYWQETRIVNGKPVLITNKKGLWATFRLKDVEGLTGEQIKEKFGLKIVPTHICDVIAPSGTKLRVGWAKEQAQWKAAGGGRQIEIEPIDVTGLKYVNERALP